MFLSENYSEPPNHYKICPLTCIILSSEARIIGVIYHFSIRTKPKTSPTDTCTNNDNIFIYLPLHLNSQLLPYTYTFEISFNPSPFILNVMKNANNPYDEMSFNSHQHVNDESTVLQQTHKHLMYGEDRLFCWYCNKTQIYSNIFKTMKGK